MYTKHEHKFIETCYISFIDIIFATDRFRHRRSQPKTLARALKLNLQDWCHVYDTGVIYSHNLWYYYVCTAGVMDTVCIDPKFPTEKKLQAKTVPIMVATAGSYM